MSPTLKEIVDFLKTEITDHDVQLTDARRYIRDVEIKVEAVEHHQPDVLARLARMEAAMVIQQRTYITALETVMATNASLSQQINFLKDRLAAVEQERVPRG